MLPQTLSLVGRHLLHPTVVFELHLEEQRGADVFGVAGETSNSGMSEDPELGASYAASGSKGKGGRKTKQLNRPRAPSEMKRRLFLRGPRSHQPA
jgi:hypothetical protein